MQMETFTFLKIKMTGASIKVTRYHYDRRHKKHTLEEYTVSLILLNVPFLSAQTPPTTNVHGTGRKTSTPVYVLGDRIHCMAVSPSLMVFAFMPGWQESRKIQQNRPGGTGSQRTLTRLSKLKTFCVHFLLFNSQPCKFMYSGTATLKPLYYAFIQLSKCSFSSGIWYDIFVKLQLGSHPVTVVQYTFTHKQYKERHKTNNKQHSFWKSAGRAPSLRVLPWHLPYNWGKSMEKPTMSVS